MCVKQQTVFWVMGKDALVRLVTESTVEFNDCAGVSEVVVSAAGVIS